MKTYTTAQAAALTSAYSPLPSVTLHKVSGGQLTPEIISGTYTEDAAQPDRSTLELVIPASYAPTSWDSVCLPTDVYAVLSYGIGLGPAFVYPRVWVDSVVVDQPAGTLTLMAMSLSRRVTQAGFPPGHRAYSGSGASVVQTIVQDALGHNVTVSVAAGLTPITVSPKEVFTGDPWSAVQGLMDRMGGWAYFDHADTLHLVPIPVPGPSNVDATVKSGEGGTLMGYSVGFTRQGANRVLMTFANPAGGSADVAATASATGGAAWDGPYGRVRAEVSRTGPMSQSQANGAAGAYMDRLGGMMRPTEVDIPVDPRLDTGDTLHVVFPNGASEYHTVTKLVVPLHGDKPMTVGTKSLPWGTL